MTGTKTWLREVDPGRNTKVKLADHRVLVAEGTGNIAIEGKDGKMATIEEVLYIPGMQCNLLSVGQFIQKGYSVTMKDNVFKLFDKHQRLILKTPLAKNRSFQTNMKAVELNCLSVIVKGAYRLYHPLNHSIVISRDVKICENEAWDWKKKEKSSSHTVPTIIEEDDQVEQV